MSASTWIRSRWVSRALSLLISLLAMVIAWDAFTLWQNKVSAAAIASAQTGVPLPERADPAQKLARAVLLSRQDESEAALLLYQDIESGQTSAEILNAARFNSANQYMRDGQKIMQSESPGRAVPLIELAKQTYRNLLIDNPRPTGSRSTASGRLHWGARYNLARALTLLPDPPPDEAPSPPREDAERAVTTMRGYSPGMP